MAKNKRALAFMCITSISFSLYSSDDTTTTQTILKKPYRHETTIALSSIALAAGLRALSKTPGILRTPCALLLVASGLTALYKTEQETHVSTVEVIAQPLYKQTVEQNYHLETIVDNTYQTAIEKIDNATIFVQEVVNEYRKKKN